MTEERPKTVTQEKTFVNMGDGEFVTYDSATVTEERQKKLLRMLAALKNEFGLTDRYQIEGWRTGRE